MGRGGREVEKGDGQKGDGQRGPINLGIELVFIYFPSYTFSSRLVLKEMY